MTGAIRRMRQGPVRILALVALATAGTLAVVGCGSSSSSGSGGSSTAGTADVSGSLSVLGVWSGQEQDSFQAVLDKFTTAYPKVSVTYNSAGDNLPTVLQTAVQGGSPPDVAFIAQPGTIQGFATDGKLQPLTFAQDAVVSNFGQSVADIGTFDGKLYGLLFKSANKSLGWYNTSAFTDAGVTPPTTWDDLAADAKTIKASGVAPYSIAGADGWTLTDLFENIYLRTAGPDKYDQLAAHTIPWTDPSVVDALTQMRTVIGDSSNIAGGTRGALQVDFPKSVTQLFSSPPAAAMTFEGDFVGGNIANETKAKAADYGVFTFPSISGSDPVVVGAGDLAVLFKDTPAGQALINFLATPEAAEAWASRGGFLSANKKLDAAVYPDDITRQIASDLADAQTFRFDMSDLAPPAFGGTAGQGEWKILQDYLKDSSNPTATAKALEAAAARAYK